MTVEERLAQYVSKARFEDLSPTAIASAKRSCLDTIAAMIAGSTAAGVDTVVKMACSWGGSKEAHLIGFGNILPAPLAAWCNGTMARALEIDDCVDFLPVHPSASAVPALLALAELKGQLSGKDFITSLAVGQDVKIRMGLAVRQNAMETGRNNMFKIFGPTAALGRALGFSTEAVQNALGLSFSYAVGDGQCALEGASGLRLQQGIVAQGALLSVLLTEQGLTGAKEFLLGRFGYLRAFEPDPRLEYLTDDIGKYFYGEQITIKPFSACRATHPSIELALKLRERISDRPIRKIVIRTCPGVYHLVAEPSEIKRPDSPAAAQFSIPFTVAAALIYGDLFLAQLEPDVINNPDVLELEARVVVRPDPSLITNVVLGKTVMEIDVEGADPIADQIELPLGNPSRPLDDAGCIEKLKKCSGYSVRPMDPTKIDRLVELVWNIEKLDNVTEIVQCLS